MIDQNIQPDVTQPEQDNEPQLIHAWPPCICSAIKMVARCGWKAPRYANEDEKPFFVGEKPPANPDVCAVCLTLNDVSPRRCQRCGMSW